MFKHEQVVDNYTFQRKDLHSEITVVVKDMFTDEIIKGFIDFMRACGHFDSCIYEQMHELAEEYFEVKQKKKEFELEPKPVLD